MKALRTLLSVAVLGSIIAFSGCGGGGGNTEPIQDQQFTKLSKKWKLKDNNGNSVLFGSGANQVDSTSHWNGFTITFSGTKGAATFDYDTERPNVPSVWQAHGTWKFGSKPATEIIRLDASGDVAITYAIDASNNLDLFFQFSGQYNSRVGNVGGYYTFHLVPAP